jgi:phosphate transport system substrate-binding protein
VKIGTRLAALGGVALVGALSLTACGTDNNSDGGGGGAAASGDCVKSTVNAAGSSAQANAMSEWIKGYQQSCAGANVNYNPNGSGAGVQAFTGGQVAFAGSDSALKPEEHGPADARCKAGKAIDLPMVGGPIAVVYNLPGVDGLQLSPATAAQIFAQKIKKWNDPAIKADNPGVSLPAQRITPVHRSDDSGTTDNFTDYLEQTSGGTWKYPADDTWPIKGGEAGEGTSGLVAAVKAGDGTIGYADESQVGDLGVAAIKVGSSYNMPTAEGAAKVLANSPKVSGRGENDMAIEVDRKSTESGAYPLSLTPYLIACPTYDSANDAALVKDYLTYVVSKDGQQTAADNAGSAPLDPSLQQQATAIVSKISAK